MPDCLPGNIDCKLYYVIDIFSQFYKFELFSNGGKWSTEYSIPVLEDITKKIVGACNATVLENPNHPLNKTVIDLLTKMKGWIYTDPTGKMEYPHQVEGWFEPKNIASKFIECFGEKLTQWDKDSDADSQRLLLIMSLCLVVLLVLVPIFVHYLNRRSNHAMSECFTSSNSNNNNKSNRSWLFGSSNSNNNARGSSSLQQDEVDGSSSKNLSNCGGWLAWFGCKTKDTKDKNENSPLKGSSSKASNSDFSAHRYDDDEILLDTLNPSSSQSQSA